MNWTHERAVLVATRIEQIAPQCDCHVALTGGCLYKDGPRKDLDLLFYSIRQKPSVNKPKLLTKLKELGFKIGKDTGFICKAELHGCPIDLFFPEHPRLDENDEYPA